jgi:AraC-like DNA-binding protein
MMRFHHFVPSAPLSRFAELFWLYEGYAPAHARERLLPMGTSELVINLLDDAFDVYSQDGRLVDRQPGAIISGPYSEFCVLDTSQQQSIIGVHFRPGGAFPFLGMPAAEIQDRQLSLDELWGRAASELRERLLAAPTPDAKFRLLEHALLARVSAPLERHPAIAFALREFTATPHRAISAVTDQIGMSARHFNTLFRNEVGLAPKLFSRIRRFHDVVHRVAMKADVDWADVAHDCGYFDQAHFINDFRAFSGLTPTAYLAQRSEHLSHVPMPD